MYIVPYQLYSLSSLLPNHIAASSGACSSCPSSPQWCWGQAQHCAMTNEQAVQCQACGGGTGRRHFCFTGRRRERTILASLPEDLYSQTSSSIWIWFLHSSVFLLLRLLTFFPVFSLPLGMPIDSEIMDEFWHSRCLNDHINLPNILWSFVSGVSTSLVAKLELILSIKS